MQSSYLNDEIKSLPSTVTASFSPAGPETKSYIGFLLY